MRRRYFSGAYGQGAGDRGGDPRASAAENRAVGSGAANEAWSPGVGNAPPATFSKPPTVPKGERINTYLNQKMPNLRHKYNLNARTKFINNNIDALVKSRFN